jgi:hypothetical protein
LNRCIWDASLLGELGDVFLLLEEEADQFERMFLRESLELIPYIFHDSNLI